MTFILKFLHTMDTSSTKLTVFFHKVYFIINTTFQLCVNRWMSVACETPCWIIIVFNAGCVLSRRLRQQKRCPQSAPRSRPKKMEVGGCLIGTLERMTVWFSFLFCRNIRILGFNFFHDWTYRSELILTPLYKNSTNKIPSLSQKTLAMTLPAQVCTFNLFSFILTAVPI